MTRRRRPRAGASRSETKLAFGDVCVADVARAWVALGAASDEQRRFIAEVLGFGYLPRVSVTPPVVVQPQRPAPAARAESAALPGPDTSGGARAATVEPPASFPLRVRPVETGRGPSQPPPWVGAPALAPEREGHAAFRPNPVPLLTPGWTRAIAAAAVATRFADGPIDLERVIDSVCRLRPLIPLPRRPVWTIRHGVQLLVDRGQGMMPFAREATRLADRIRAIAGRDRTSILLFRDCPARRRKSSDGSGPAYMPPASGVPVVVITDLGLVRGAMLRGGASEAEWMSFAAIVRQANCPLIAFVPCALTRVPPALRRVLHAVPWDRATTVGLVQQITRGITR